MIANTKRKEKDLVGGVEQLAEAVGLTPYSSVELFRTLRALFHYRHKMFHCGFEWPADESEGFSKRSEQEVWRTWFASAKYADEPWTFI